MTLNTIHFLYRQNYAPELYYHYLVSINRAITSQMEGKENLIRGHEISISNVM